VKAKRTKARTGAKKVLTARSADRYALYEMAVQTPDEEVRFFDRVYRGRNGRLPQVLREDFCATAAISRSWVKKGKERAAVGLDLDAKPLEWARRVGMNGLSGEERERIELVKTNVLHPKGVKRKADVVSAGNFSWWVFKERKILREYFAKVREGLAEGGVFVLDLMGGTQASAILTERRRCKGFTYEWEQREFNAVTHELKCAINFIFRDGTKMKNAFEYDWRLWSIPEAREVLAEAGFKTTTVYWEGDDDKGGGSGEYRRTETGESCMCHVTYIVAHD
jgi:hypothetical protein